MRTSLRQIVRRLFGSPAFTVTVVATLALGIAATVAVFSVISGVLLSPLPFHEPERLVGVWHKAPGLGFDQVNQCAGLDLVYRDDSTAFESTGMWTRERSAVTGNGEPEEVETIGLTATMLPLLGIDAALGRRFSVQDDVPDAPLTVMLSHAYWQRRWGGSEATIGQQVRLDGRSRTVIGVLPPRFSFLGTGADLYYPLQIDPSEAVVGQFNYQGIGRLRAGVTLDQANADMNRLLPVALERFPGGLSAKMMEQAGFAGALIPLQEQVVGSISQTLWILLAAVGLVLLVACANVANLYLVRGEGRYRELAVRSALGATRGRLALALLAESLILGLLGGVLALVLAWGMVRLLIWFGPDSVPRLDQVRVDGGVMLFALAVSLFAGLLFGLFPAFRHAGGGDSASLSAALKEGGRGGSAGRERYRARSALVVAQVALGLVLLVGSGLMLRSFLALRDVEPGFTDPQELLTFRVSVPSAEIEDPHEAALLEERIIERLASLPGVESVGATSSMTMDVYNSNDALLVEDFPAEEGSLPPIRRYKFITPGYFETMGNPVFAGRGLEWADLHEARLVAVITANFATEVWGEPGAALGRRIADGVPGEEEPMWREIVGVVGDIRDDGVAQEPVATVFWPAAMPRFWGNEPFVQRSLSYVLRSERTGTASLLREAQQAVWTENANLPLAKPETANDILQRSLAHSSFAMLMLGLAAGIALVLGSVGIYGVISYIVSQRTREIGVRLALGAKGSDVHSMMVRYGMGLAMTGVVLGLAVSALLSGTLSRMLYGVEPRDPVTFVVVAILLSLVALLASTLAGRRAARVDALTALRAE